MTTCVTCDEPLVVEIEPDDDDEDVGTGGSSVNAALKKTVPDDVHLNCGCHYHWECLLDAYTVSTCPNCSKELISRSSTDAEQLLCNLNNEGGLQENLDILPLLTEETYLKAYPEERKARAFLDFCREGDFKAIVGMLQNDETFEDDDEDESMQEGQKIDFLRYQDPVGEMRSGLHYAVEAGSREVVWLLLLVASDLNMMEFPALVFQEAGSLGIMRGDMEGKTDIRTLRDAQGRTAEQVAAEMDGIWHGWPGSGRLAA